ncbi:MAG: hypothetical protein VKJ06_02985 [Vampirovibrionales bacterium]|nr:hypothetical protein [Vampirovibrionales bacterium]
MIISRNNSSFMAPQKKAPLLPKFGVTKEGGDSGSGKLDLLINRIQNGETADWKRLTQETHGVPRGPNNPWDGKRGK